MNLKEELKRIDDFLNNLSPEGLYEMLDRNGYGIIGVSPEDRMETGYENDTLTPHYYMEDLMDSVVVENNSSTTDTYPEAA
jgi:hypothetical protein